MLRISCLAAPPAFADLVRKPYLELVALASTLDYSPKAIDEFHKQRRKAREEILVCFPGVPCGLARKRSCGAQIPP